MEMGTLVKSTRYDVPLGTVCGFSGKPITHYQVKTAGGRFYWAKASEIVATTIEAELELL